MKKKYKVETEDQIVVNVIKMLDDRSKKGFETYGMPLEKDDTRSYQEWLIMAQEELLDGANYLEKLKVLSHPSLECTWAKYENEVKLLTGAFDCDKVEDVEEFVNRIRQLPEVDKLNIRIDSLNKSNDALLREADYLRSQLRRDDKDFYDHREVTLKESESAMEKDDNYFEVKDNSCECQCCQDLGEVGCTCSEVVVIEPCEVSLSSATEPFDHDVKCSQCPGDCERCETYV